MMEIYNDILAVVKDEHLARGVLQAVLLTGLNWQDIVKSIGIEI